MIFTYSKNYRLLALFFYENWVVVDVELRSHFMNSIYVENLKQLTSASFKLPDLPD